MLSENIEKSFEEELKGYLLDLLGTLKEGGEFLMEQLPIFVQEYLNWSIASHSLGVIIGLILLFVAYKTGKFIFTEMPKKESGEFYSRYDPNWSHKTSITNKGGFSMLACMISSLAGIPLLLINLFQLVKVLVAPRVYLIENLIHLVQ